MRKHILSFTLLVLLSSGPAFAAPREKKAKSFEREKTQKLNPEPTQVKSFEREKTQKLNFEPTQVESPDAVRGDGEPKNPLLTPAEIESTNKEIKRLRALIESGQQMLAESEGNQSAQIKIMSTLTLLELEMRKLNEKLRGSTPASGESAAGVDSTVPAEGSTSENPTQTAQEQMRPASNETPVDAAPSNNNSESMNKKGE
ncbi:MAG: hypothetical protein RLZZ488_2716 [Pseudomonadota bacterium]|jgi:hypothetical protein